MKINTVIFDVDGVLLDSVPYHFNAWKKLFEKEGLTFTFEDYLKKVNGLPRLVGIKNILTDRSQDELEKLSGRKQDYLTEMIKKSSPNPLPGAMNIINTLQSMDYKLVAASSSKNAPLLLEKSGIAPHLKDIVSGHDFKHPKPHPDIFLTAAARVNSTSEECVVIEDAAIGIQAAKNAKMKAIGVMTSNDSDLKNIADLVIDSLENRDEILEFIS